MSNDEDRIRLEQARQEGYEAGFSRAKYKAAMIVSATYKEMGKKSPHSAIAEMHTRIIALKGDQP